MFKKIICAVLLAAAFASCSKEESKVEKELSSKATVHLSLTPYQVETKNTDPNHGINKHLDSVATVDVFVFRETGVLDAYKHFSINTTEGVNLSDLQIDATVGQRNVYVVANAKETSWAGITTEDQFKALTVSLQKESLRFFTMTAFASVNLQESMTVNLTLVKLVAKVVVRGIRTNFAGTPYEGQKIRSVKLYLTNVSGAKTYLGKDPQTKVVFNSGGFSQKDYDGCIMTALFKEGVPGLVDDTGYATAHHFYCYENLLSSETSSDKFTRLVLEAELGGKVYYYPVDINRPGYGWNSAIDHKGVKRNTCYTYNFTITGPGSDDPESKIALKTITVDASVESFGSIPGYSVSF